MYESAVANFVCKKDGRTSRPEVSLHSENYYDTGIKTDGTQKSVNHTMKERSQQTTIPAGTGNQSSRSREVAEVVVIPMKKNHANNERENTPIWKFEKFKKLKKFKKFKEENVKIAV